MHVLFYGINVVGCNVMIASRNGDRLRDTAEELFQQLPKEGGPRIDYTVCNIRQEEQVAGSY